MPERAIAPSVDDRDAVRQRQARPGLEETKAAIDGARIDAL
jgi:hypothetical protein